MQRDYGLVSHGGEGSVRSDTPQVKLRGIALWFTVAYYETKDSKYGEA